MPVDDTLLQECHITHLAWTHGLTIWCQYHIKKHHRLPWCDRFYIGRDSKFSSCISKECLLLFLNKHLLKYVVSQLKCYVIEFHGRSMYFKCAAACSFNQMNSLQTYYISHQFWFWSEWCSDSDIITSRINEQVDNKINNKKN